MVVAGAYAELLKVGVFFYHTQDTPTQIIVLLVSSGDYT